VALPHDANGREGAPRAAAAAALCLLLPPLSFDGAVMMVPENLMGKVDEVK
jgi:hypothetical protein